MFTLKSIRAFCRPCLVSNARLINVRPIAEKGDIKKATFDLIHNMRPMSSSLTPSDWSSSWNSVSSAPSSSLPSWLSPPVASPPPFEPKYTLSAGLESWHKRRPVPGSAGRVYKWPCYNDVIHPPTFDVKDYKPAYICHMRPNLKYSWKKMWYIASMVRGMTIDEAIKQLSFVNKKGAIFARETLEEARDIAVNEHHVEYRTNLWVAESFCNKGMTIKGYRRSGRGTISTIRYGYINYFVRLEEGEPPEHYYEYKAEKSQDQWLQNYVEEQRKKIVPYL